MNDFKYLIEVRTLGLNSGTLRAMNSPFIPLGSGEVLPWETHESLTLIHQLKLFNFPVPNGIVLIHPPFLEQELRPDFLGELQDEIKQRELKSTLSVTAFFYGERPFILKKDCSAESLGSFFKEMGSQMPSNARMDFLILEQFEGQARGQAFSQSGYGDDRIEFQLGSTNHLMPLTSLWIEKLTVGETKIHGDFRGRVQDLLRSIRKALGEDNWVVGWVDSKDVVFLTSIEKMGSLPLLTDIFFRLPKWEVGSSEYRNLEGSLITSISSKLFHYFHRWSPDLSEARPFVRWKKNQIDFNLSLISDFLRSFGLSTQSLKLLFNNLSFSPIPLNTVRFWRNLPRLIRFFHDLTLGAGIATSLSNKLTSFDTSPDKSFSELFQEWQSIYLTSSHALYRLTMTFVLISSPFERLKFIENLNNKTSKSEELLKKATTQALTKCSQAIQMKALGWFSRGVLSNEEDIWNLTKDQVLDLEQKLKYT